MIICIGPKGSGKTLLLRKLQQVDPYNNPYDSIFATVPTMGVNIVNVKLHNKFVQINELGGSMAPIWPMHYEDIKGVIFVIDATNLMQISCASILLLETLKHALLRNTYFLIVFNKTDIPCSTQLSEMKCILRLDDICLHAAQNITIADCSCLTSKGEAVDQEKYKRKNYKIYGSMTLVRGILVEEQRDIPDMLVAIKKCLLRDIAEVIEAICFEIGIEIMIISGIEGLC